MGLVWASYYGLARVSEAGPEVKNWVVTDTNWQVTSLLLKRFEAHHHNASTPVRYPGYNILNPATPATPLLTQSPTGGFIAAGTSLGVRMSFLDQYGLETEASPETVISMPPVVTRPNAITAGAPVATPMPGAVTGGTYLYAITKRLNTGESQLSDVTTVDVPFDSTGLTSYTVPLQFDPISLYTDGTDSLCIYKTTGFDSAFVLLTTLTATPGLQNNVVSYTDTAAVQDPAHQPPQASEFGKQNMVTINWANINIPGSAYRLRIYLTQQTGIWGDNNLFQDYFILDPATPLPTQVSFIGTETLSTGYPIDFTQIPYGAPLINLSTEAIGAPIYTQAADAQGYQTYNFVLPDQTHTTPITGNMYVDSSTGQLKARLTSAGYTTIASGSIYDAAVLSDSPVSFLPLKETSGGTAADIADSNPGGYFGGITLGAPGPANDGETAPVLDGSTAEIDINSAPNLQLTTPMSLETWVNPRDRNANMGVIPKGQDYRLYISNTTGVVNFDWNNQQAGFAATTPIPVNTWTHLVVTYDGATANMYINGQRNNSFAKALLPSKSNSTIFMGSSTGRFKGAMAKPAFYNTILSSQRVLAHYNAASQSGYVHPTVEQGGHAASGIQFAPQVGGPTLDQIGSIIATPVPGPSQAYRKQASNIYKITATPSDLVNSTAGTWLNMADMTTTTQFVTGISPSFPGQWAECEFQTFAEALAGTTTGQVLTGVLTINGIQINETMSSIGGTHVANNTTAYGQLNFTYATPLTRSNNVFAVQWMLSFPGWGLSYGGNVPGQAPRRYFMIKEIF